MTTFIKKFVLISLLTLLTCRTNYQFNYKKDSYNLEVLATYPEISFAVLADPHYYDINLGTESSLFWQQIGHGNKLFQLSHQLLQTALERISAQKDIKFILICGDLTKDGEKHNHLALAKILSEVAKKGVQVFVVPGNHDIKNSSAAAFPAEGVRRLESITAQEFSDIYKDFGYKVALDRDPASLSYLVEPVPGLWLLGLDSCTYENKNHSTRSATKGALLKATLNWVEQKLIQANLQKKAVIGFMHHGLLEHFQSQKKYFNDFVIDNWQEVSALFAHYGMRFVFTGHFHANDLTRYKFNNKFVVDIQTSALVTYPNCFRILTFKDNKLIVKSQSIEILPGYFNFRLYSFSAFFNNTIFTLKNLLKRYNFSESDLGILSPQIALALASHFKGDELKPSVLVRQEGLSPGSKILLAFLNDLIQGVWQDLPPSDNNLELDIFTGEEKD